MAKAWEMKQYKNHRAMDGQQDWQRAVRLYLFPVPRFIPAFRY